MNPMDLRTIAEQLTGISKSRSEAASDTGKAVRSLYEAYASFEHAYVAAKELEEARAFVGSQLSELREMCEYLRLARDIMAEAAFAIADLHPNKSQFVVELDAMSTAAREGMQAKRLAAWEPNALREAVVQALAGEEGTP